MLFGFARLFSFKWNVTSTNFPLPSDEDARPTAGKYLVKYRPGWADKAARDGALSTNSPSRTNGGVTA